MDMTYFAFTPANLKNMKLKIAIVFLHDLCRFDVWLGASNRSVQSDFIESLRKKNLGTYKLSTVGPGVDSIIESILIEEPDFNMPDKIMRQIEQRLFPFIEDINALLDK